MPRRTDPTPESPRALKSYLARISDARKARTLSSFAAFPEGTGFSGQDRDEHIVLLLRQHPAVFIPKILLVTGMFLLPLIIVPLAQSLNTDFSAGDITFGLGVLVLWIMFAISIVAVTFFKWFFNVNIVTNQRILDIDFDNLFNHVVSEAQLEKIEDVTHSAVGMWAVIFDFGTVYVQTAAEQREFEFRNIPRPRDVQDTINDLLELKQSNG